MASNIFLDSEGWVPRVWPACLASLVCGFPNSVWLSWTSASATVGIELGCKVLEAASLSCKIAR